MRRYQEAVRRHGRHPPERGGGIRHHARQVRQAAGESCGGVIGLSLR
jgi:hypothetical protein